MTDDGCGQTCESACFTTCILAMAHSDGYAARDALTHPQLRRAMTVGQHRALTSLVRTAGLDAGTVPEPWRSDLMRAVTSAQDRLRLCLEDSAVTSPATAPPAAEASRGAVSELS